jgi:ABC-2 type transport system ATP-binding protein
MNPVAVAEFENLTVKYKNFTALESLSVAVPPGCTGLLGPNGAGKTTLLKTILGFVKPAEGTGKVLGFDMLAEGKEIRRRIGLMPEQNCHIPGMSAVRYVAFAGELSGMPSEQAMRRAHEVLEYCGLGEARYRNVETYSTGMLQRIKLAQALVHGPQLLLLDEPTNGLDPAGRISMLELIRTIARERNLNVIVSSHLLPDIERTCDQVVVLFRGKLAAEGSIKDLKKVRGAPFDVELFEDSPEFVEVMTRQGAELLEHVRQRYRMRLPMTIDESAAICFATAEKTGAEIRGFTPAERTLEEVFLEAVGG